MATRTISFDQESLRFQQETGFVPKQRYLDGDFAKLETERLWSKVWQWACLDDDLPDPGSFYEHQVGDQSVLIIRGQDGVLRGFHNVCPHRGNRLRGGSGVLRTELACNYHRWTWDLEGKLLRVPDRDGFSPFDDGCFALRRVSVDVWNHFVFVSLDRNPQPLLDYLAPLTERLAPYHWDQHTCTSSLTLPMAANWKTMVDGFLDVYHLQGVHPQLLRYTDDVTTTYERLGLHSAMYMPMGVPSPKAPNPTEQGVLNELAKPGSGIMGKMIRQSPHFHDFDGKPALTAGVTVRDALIEGGRRTAEELGRDYAGLTDEQLIDDHHYFFFPNTIMNVFAGHFIAARMRPDGTDPERCFFDLFIFNWLTAEESRVREPRRHELLAEGAKVGRVPDQDFTALPKVQLGLHSQGLDKLFLAAHGQEVRVSDFHVVLDAYLYSDSGNPPAG